MTSSSFNAAFHCFIVILIIHIKHLFTLFFNFYIQSYLELYDVMPRPPWTRGARTQLEFTARDYEFTTSMERCFTARELVITTSLVQWNAAPWRILAPCTQWTIMSFSTASCSLATVLSVALRLFATMSLHQFCVTSSSLSNHCQKFSIACFGSWLPSIWCKWISHLVIFFRCSPTFPVVWLPHLWLSLSMSIDLYFIMQKDPTYKNAPT